MPDEAKVHSQIGCCGIDCVLCPRYYTEGSSRCPGCAGLDFHLKHPTCTFVTCCHKQRGLEVCAECPDFPCARFARETSDRDSFVTHRRVLPNQYAIQSGGLAKFLEQQQRRRAFLETALTRFNDGRSKNLYCLAAALLTPASLEDTLAKATDSANLKELLRKYAEEQGEELKLRK